MNRSLWFVFQAKRSVQFNSNWLYIYIFSFCYIQRCVCGCFCYISKVQCFCLWQYGLQSQKNLLSGPCNKKIAGSWSVYLRAMSLDTSHSPFSCIILTPCEAWANMTRLHLKSKAQGASVLRFSLTSWVVSVISLIFGTQLWGCSRTSH